jgi:hypothetical protein
MPRPTFASRALAFYKKLVPPSVPRGVVVMNPYADRAAIDYTRAFLERYFDDDRPRTLVFGINPGRFGSGITGVTFTDPVALADFCGVPNTLGRTRELSSVFIYEAVAAFGGPAAFFSRFFLTALSPLGFTTNGVNLNYYDRPDLLKRVTPFIVESVERQIALGARTDHAVVLGIGKNAKCFAALNATHRWFGTLHALEHPRWIMQYRRKRVAEFAETYVRTLRDLP